MSAGKATATKTAPARHPQTSPGRGNVVRLRPSQPAQQRKLKVVNATLGGRAMRWMAPVAMAAIFGVLMLMAVIQTMVVQGQRELDRLAVETKTAQLSNDALELQLAELEAPQRIVDAARVFGMVDAPMVVYLSPGTVAVAE